MWLVCFSLYWVVGLISLRMCLVCGFLSVLCVVWFLLLLVVCLFRVLNNCLMILMLCCLVFVMCYWVVLVMWWLFVCCWLFIIFCCLLLFVIISVFCVFVWNCLMLVWMRCLVWWLVVRWILVWVLLVVRRWRLSLRCCFRNGLLLFVVVIICLCVRSVWFGMNFMCMIMYWWIRCLVIVCCLIRCWWLLCCVCWVFVRCVMLWFCLGWLRWGLVLLWCCWWWCWGMIILLLWVCCLLNWLLNGVWVLLSGVGVCWCLLLRCFIGWLLMWSVVVLLIVVYWYDGVGMEMKDDCIVRWVWLFKLLYV